MHENCDRCHTDYEFTKDNSRMNLYIENPECNNVEATCTNCGGVERMYIHADAFLQVMQQSHAGLNLRPRADDELKARAAATWGEVEAQEAAMSPELPEPPKEWLRSLYDDLRNWRGEME